MYHLEKSSLCAFDGGKESLKGPPLPGYLIIGFLGGACGELITILEFRHTHFKDLPPYLKHWFYWLCVLG